VVFASIESSKLVFDPVEPHLALHPELPQNGFQLASPAASYYHVSIDMILSQQQMQSIRALCECYDVAELFLFGSALHSDRFNETSDFDFAVTFADPERINGSFERYMGLLADLEKLLGREVDLVSYQSIRNPYFKQEVDETKHAVFSLHAA